MIKIMENIKNMSYAGSGKIFEAEVLNLLEKAGFTKESMPTPKRATRDSWLKDEENSMSENSFIYQPCGSQDSPDFIVKSKGKLYFLECKSTSKDGTPTWNSGGIHIGGKHRDYIFLITSGKYNATTFAFGKDIMDTETAQEFENLQAKIDSIVKEFNDSIVNTRGFYYYPRAMVSQKIPGKDFFTHEDRALCETKVLEFVK